MVPATQNQDLVEKPLLRRGVEKVENSQQKPKCVEFNITGANGVIMVS